TYFSGGGVLLSAGLADYLDLHVGDTAVFISQGYHGTNAAGKYPITGILTFPTPDLNKQIAFLPLDEAQWFYAAEQRVTSVVLDPEDPDELSDVVAAVRQAISDDQIVVRDYQELIPGLLEAKAFDEAGGIVILMILYAIIGFGIFGTVLMMIKEREYEFGILKAIGMKSHQLQLMLWLETVILAMIGCAAGMVVAFPLVYYLQEHPIRFTGEMAEAYEKFGVEAIMPATVDPSIFLNQAAVVVVMITIMTLYPLWKIRGLNAVQAMRD
ncbi:MAG: FtsX-like permease family protein, partial [Saprospiraceae bacterium]|nr:FtsX-like permease family protein [Saprospiraceae bacterium]